jgi:hypothetical protein
MQIFEHGPDNWSFKQQANWHRINLELRFKTWCELLESPIFVGFDASRVVEAANFDGVLPRALASIRAVFSHRLRRHRMVF